MQTKSLIGQHSLYVLVKGPSWDLARLGAKALGGDLVVINDQIENDLLYTWLLLQGPKEWPAFWIGITDRNIEGSWLDVNGNTIQYSHWADGEPNNAKNIHGNTIISEEDFAVLDTRQNGFWNDSHQQFDPIIEVAPYGIAELKLSPILRFESPPTEGLDTCRLNITITAGTRNVPVNNITIYWRFTGITLADLKAGTLQGSMPLNNGQCALPYQLKLDDDYGETLEFTVYADAQYKQKIGDKISCKIEENRAPTNLRLKQTNIFEQCASGTLIGFLSGTDPDSNNLASYTLVKGNGRDDADNSLVKINGNRVISNENSFIDFETNPVLNLSVQITDHGIPSRSLTRAFEIPLTDIEESNLQPSAIEFCPKSINITYPNDLAIDSNTLLQNYYLITIIDTKQGTKRIKPTTATLVKKRTISLTIPPQDEQSLHSVMLTYSFFSDYGSKTTLLDNGGKQLAGFENQAVLTYTTEVESSWKDLPHAFRRLILVGTRPLQGNGNEFGNTIIGNASDNQLDGKQGLDTLAGGEGNDTYIIDSTEDIVTEKAGEGDDTIKSSISYELPPHIENLELAGNAKINAKGNNEDNHLIGNNANNIFTADPGDDVIDGSTGLDICDYTLIHADLQLDLSRGHVTGAGNDSLIAVETFWSGSGNDILHGNEASNVITGAAGDDLISGGPGNDTLNGNDGQDTFWMDSGNDKIDGGNGIDTLDLSEATKPFWVNLKTKIAEGDGNDTLNSIETIIGSPLDDLLTGNDEANSIAGNNGNDYITGGLGADSLSGGKGFNIFSYGLGNESCLQAFDKLIEFDTSKDSIHFGSGKNKTKNIIDFGSISSVTQDSFNQLFTTLHVAAGTVGYLKTNEPQGQRYFLIINDDKSVFSSRSDLLLELVNLRGHWHDIKFI